MKTLKDEFNELIGLLLYVFGFQHRTSSGIDGGLTRGYGKLDDNGYWQYQIPYGCYGGKLTFLDAYIKWTGNCRNDPDAYLWFQFNCWVDRPKGYKGHTMDIGPISIFFIKCELTTFD